MGECDINDMDEHASSKVSLKNIDMKIKLNLEKEANEAIVPPIQTKDDNYSFKKHKRAQSTFLHHKLLAQPQLNAHLKPPHKPMRSPALEKKESKMTHESSSGTQNMFNQRTKNSVFKSSKGSLTGKDLQLVGKNIKKMEN